MNEEEIIEDYINFIKVFAKKEQIENVNHLTFRGRRKEQLKILKNFLDLYQKEKEKNTAIEIYRKDMPKDTKLIIMRKEDFDKNFKSEYVSKSKIKAKIEDITDYYEKEVKPEMYHWGDFTAEQHYADTIAVLQELLEEE